MRVVVVPATPQIGAPTLDAAAPTEAIASVALLDDTCGVLVRSTGGEVTFVNDRTTFSVTSGAAWLSGTGSVGLASGPEGQGVRALYPRDHTFPYADDAVSRRSGRGRLLALASHSYLAAFSLQDDTGHTSLALRQLAEASELGSRDVLPAATCSAAATSSPRRTRWSTRRRWAP